MRCLVATEAHSADRREPEITLFRESFSAKITQAIRATLSERSCSAARADVSGTDGRESGKHGFESPTGFVHWWDTLAFDLGLRPATVDSNGIPSPAFPVADLRRPWSFEESKISLVGARVAVESRHPKAVTESASFLGSCCSR